ncbi:uncharacterized protein LOC126375639 isoform X2 [Pectinophora gossypiella]|uniref:uncharacterized protein LOC126375639 isoform X2 n=1 Tax=Pectinophora gossypiella TaxID=13191 RepID=UPI00214E2F8B|nr:uncharacterized protein LOC126375639 isoform X2 [Pectinophora gossypiella]
MSVSNGEEDVAAKLSKLKLNRGYNKDPKEEMSEDIATTEDKMYSVLSILDREIASRKQVLQPPPPPPPAKRLVNLPTLGIPIFADSYTGRAYHMERDTSAEPTVKELLAFLEKRALAMENAEPPAKPSTSNAYGNRQSRLAVNVAAVGSKPACNYYTGAPGEPAQRASAEPHAAAEPGGAAA